MRQRVPVAWATVVLVGAAALAACGGASSGGSTGDVRVERRAGGEQALPLAANATPARAAPTPAVHEAASPSAARSSGTPAARSESTRAGAPRPAARRQAAWDGPAQVLWRGAGARRSVALTFDAGADLGYVESILDILRNEGVRASFGVTGVWAEQHPEVVRRMAAEGHQVINHSYDHTSFTGLSTNRRPLTTEQRQVQIDRAEAVIQELTGTSTLPFFRAPYGDTDASVLRDIASRGYAYNVLWTVDSRGWTGASASAIVRRCLDLAEPGAIYVFHVGGASQDGLALPAIIAGLRAAGYAFETVEEIADPNLSP